MNEAGLAVTSWGVLDDGHRLAREVCVRAFGGVETRGVVFFAHRVLGIALLWLEAPREWSALPPGDPARLRHGEELFEIASSSSVQATKVRNLTLRAAGVELFQVEAGDEDSGESGRPFVNARGEVVAIGVSVKTGLRVGKVALPIDYLTKDIMVAVGHGSDACLRAPWCVMCGSTQFNAVEWFCRTCGHQWQKRGDDGGDELGMAK